MKKIYILKMGSTIPTLIDAYGDFDQWIIDGLQCDINLIQVCNIRAGELLPSINSLSGLVISGAHDMVTDHQPWSERSANWLLDVIEHTVSILGICYGHQLLAYALGGKVGDNPQGGEFGTVTVSLTERAQNYPLFREFTSSFKAQVSHTQSVFEFPERAKLLAFNSVDRIQAFSYGSST